MKRFAALILMICMIPFLTGCGSAVSASAKQAALTTIGDVNLAAEQATGATAAIAALVTDNPVMDKNTASQINGYAAWASFALQALGVAAKFIGPVL